MSLLRSLLSLPFCVCLFLLLYMTCAVLFLFGGDFWILHIIPMQQYFPPRPNSGVFPFIRCSFQPESVMMNPSLKYVLPSSPIPQHSHYTFKTTPIWLVLVLILVAVNIKLIHGKQLMCVSFAEQCDWKRRSWGATVLFLIIFNLY